MTIDESDDEKLGRKPLKDILEKFRQLAPDFMKDGRGEHEQGDREAMDDAEKDIKTDYDQG